MKYFLHICSPADDKKHQHEWGFWREYIPTVGDILHLSYGPRDGESEDFLEGVVVAREFYLSAIEDEEDDSEDIWIRVKLEQEMPEDRIPDSDAWPCKLYSQQQREIQTRLEEIRSGK